MIQYTPEAERIRDDYLHQVRIHVGATKAADPEEVIRDIVDHIERELQESQQPVTADQLQAVLTRLGSPRQWIQEEDLSWWRQITLRLRSGPEDWRLAYLSLGVLIFGSVAGGLGLLGSFCLSRAAVSFADKEELEAKKWLIYPSLIIVYVLGSIVVLLWPAAAAAGLAVELVGSRGLLYKPPLFSHDGFGMVLATVAAMSVGLAVWWSILLLLVRRHPDIPVALFRPFADNWKGRRLGLIVLLTAALAVFLFVGTTFLWTHT